jgi:axial budding pattern protein 2
VPPPFDIVTISSTLIDPSKPSSSIPPPALTQPDTTASSSHYETVRASTSRADEKSKANRNTTIGPAPSTRLATPEPARIQGQKKYSLGLGIFDTPAESSPLVIGEGGRERTPLSMLADENGASPAPPERDRDRLRVVEGKGKRPVSQEVGEELRAGASRKGRTTWGSSLKRVVTGGRSYWEGKGDGSDGKMFL